MWIPKGCLVPKTPGCSHGTTNNPLPTEFKTFLRFSFMSLLCTRYLGMGRPPCSTQGTDTEVRRPSHPVALPWVLQLMFITNPTPLSAAVWRAEPIVIQVSTEPTTMDLKPGSTEDITYFRRKVTHRLPPASVLRHPRGHQHAKISIDVSFTRIELIQYQYSSTDIDLFLIWNPKFCKKKTNLE